MAKREGKLRGFWIGLTCFVLVAAIVVGVFSVGTKGFKDWSFSRWFPKNGKEQQEATTSGTVISGEESYGVSLASMEIPVEDYATYGVSRAAQNAYSLTATFIPENTTFQEVDYSLYFDTTSKPEYATWAQGKEMTAYAEITQNETDSRKATVTFKQSFGAPIMVKATSRRNTQIYATIRADYVCKFGSFIVNYVDTVESDIPWTYAWGEGTVLPTLSQCEAKFVLRFNHGFISKMANYGFTVPEYYREIIWFSDDWTSDSDITNIKDIIMNAGGAAAQSDPDGYWGAACNAALNGIEPEGEDEICLGGCTIGISRVYNGVTYSEYTEIDDFMDFTVVDGRGFEVQATSMGVTEDGGSSSLVMG